MSGLDDLASVQATARDGRNLRAVAEDEQADPRERLEAMLGLPGVELTITAAHINGRGSAATADIHLSDGTTIELDSLGVFSSPVRLAVLVTAATGSRCPVYSVPQGLELLRLLRQIAEHERATSDRDVSVNHGLGYLREAETLDLNMADQSERYGAFKLLERHRDHNLVLRDATTGERFVYTAWMFEYVQRHDTIGTVATLAAKMERTGWRRRGTTGRIKATDRVTGSQIVRPFFVVPPGWEDEQEADE